MLNSGVNLMHVVVFCAELIPQALVAYRISDTKEDAAFIFELPVICFTDHPCQSIVTQQARKPINMMHLAGALGCKYQTFQGFYWCLSQMRQH